MSTIETLPPYLAKIGRLEVYDTKKLQPCVYFLIRDFEVVYVGQSVTLATRLCTHSKEKKFDQVCYVPIFPEDNIIHVETAFIHAFSPQLNGKPGLCPLSERDRIFLAKYEASYLAASKDQGVPFKKLVMPGDYGPVQIIRGRYKGKFAYYDDDDSDLEMCLECEDAVAGMEESDGCPDCITTNRAIVYLGSWDEGYILMDHSKLRSLDCLGEENSESRGVAKTLFPDFDDEEIRITLETGDPIHPLRLRMQRKTDMENQDGR